MNKALVALGLLLASSLAYAQEIAYVTDILRLGIHRAEDTSDAPFKNLVSGTELTILEQLPNYARVRTSDGEEGWVKSAYLVTGKPAQLRVSEIESEVDLLRVQLADAKSAQHLAESEVHRVSEAMSIDVNSSAAIRDTLARLQMENQSFEQRLEQYRGTIPLAWVAGALLAALAAGFLGGIWWLDSLIRRRFGGFRIY